MDIVQLIAQTGGTLGLAIFAIFMLNRVWELRLEEAKSNAASERERADQMRDALDRNTQVMTRVVDLVERLRQS